MTGLEELIDVRIRQIACEVLDQKLSEIIEAFKVHAPDNEELLTCKEVAGILKTNTQQIYRLAREEQLTGVWLGENTLRFERTAITEFVKGGGAKQGGKR